MSYLDHLVFHERLVDEGKTIYEIALIRGVKPKTIYDYLSQHDLLKKYRKKHPRESARSRYKGLQEMAVKGELDLTQMGKYFGEVTRARMGQVLEEEGLHSGWKEAREAYKKMMKEQRKKRKEELERLEKTIYLLAREKAKEDKPSQKLLEYLDRSRWICYNPDFLFEFFKEYYHLKESGEASLDKKLAKSFGLYPSSVWRILKKVGEKPKTRDSRRLTEEQKEIVDKAIKSDTELSYVIMEKLTGIPRYVFSQRGRKIGIQKEVTIPLCSLGRGERLGHDKTIDLLEALDADLTKEEAMEYAGIKKEQVFEWVISHGDGIRAEANRFMREIGLDEVF